MSDNVVPTTCPSCGSMAECEAVTTILPGSVALDNLFKGQLNTCICSMCDQTFRIGTPILYRDDQTRTLVYLLPEEDADEEIVDMLVNQMVQSTFGTDAEAATPTVRVVTEQPHFLEKIAIFQKGMDDRLVEYVKYLLFQNSDDIDFESHELLYDFSNESPDDICFIAFDRQTQKGEYGLAFEKADYEELVTTFAESPEAAAKLDELFPGHIVSVRRLMELADAEDLDDE